MDSGSEKILEENLRSVNLSLKRLIYSFDKCKKIGLKNTYTVEEFVAFEAMAARYSRTTDMLVNKVLRSIDKIELEESGTIIDIINRAEKREFVSSAKILRTIKELRNNIAHEYKTEEISKFFSEILENTPLLLEIIENVNKYCDKYLEKA